MPIQGKLTFPELDIGDGDGGNDGEGDEDDTDAGDGYDGIQTIV